MLCTVSSTAVVWQTLSSLSTLCNLGSELGSELGCRIWAAEFGLPAWLSTSTRPKRSYDADLAESADVPKAYYFNTGSPGSMKLLQGLECSLLSQTRMKHI